MIVLILFIALISTIFLCTPCLAWWLRLFKEKGVL